MQRIVAGIDTIEQHLEAIRQTPEVYRPPCCPHCGLKILGTMSARPTAEPGRFHSIRYRSAATAAPAVGAPVRVRRRASQRAAGMTGRCSKPTSNGCCANTPISAVHSAARRTGAPPVAGGTDYRSAACCSSFTCAPSGEPRTVPFLVFTTSYGLLRTVAALVIVPSTGIEPVSHA